MTKMSHTCILLSIVNSADETFPGVINVPIDVSAHAR